MRMHTAVDLRRGGARSDHHPTAPEEPIWVNYNPHGAAAMSPADHADHAAFIAATSPLPDGPPRPEDTVEGMSDAEPSDDDE